jgi:glycerol kinase
MATEKYILGIDQSTSGTKAMLFDKSGKLFSRFDLEHKQIVDERGWVEHDPMEIYRNTIAVVRGLVEKSGIDKNAVVGIGISNQRETALIWDPVTGIPEYNAIVWQCARGEAICTRIARQGDAAKVKEITGLRLSPYFSAAKIAWILENVGGLKGKKLYCGTIDTWLVYKLTGNFKTDYSNASRTQLFDLHQLCWSDEMCSLFGINTSFLPELTDSNGFFGETNFEEYFSKPVPIRGVLGDSHGALFGQGCLEPGTIKATYGTGSSVMMNIGERPINSENLVTSLAWGMNGRINYVLEGNINYTGAVIKWLVDDLGLIVSSRDAGVLSAKAKNIDGLYFVPAFSGLGAPYWDGNARTLICGIDRGCGKAELVRAAEEAIAYQITDILHLMRTESRIEVNTLKVDGGPTRDKFLMQFQADIADIKIVIPEIEELSGTGAAYAAGIALGIYDKTSIFEHSIVAQYSSTMSPERREKLFKGWREAVRKSLSV